MNTYLVEVNLKRTPIKGMNQHWEDVISIDGKLTDKYTGTNFFNAKTNYDYLICKFKEELWETANEMILDSFLELNLNAGDEKHHALNDRFEKSLDKQVYKLTKL